MDRRGVLHRDAAGGNGTNSLPFMLTINQAEAPVPLQESVHAGEATIARSA